MPIGICFWVLMLLWLACGPFGWWPIGGSWMLFILLFLLGWQVFGFIVQGKGSPS